MRRKACTTTTPCSGCTTPVSATTTCATSASTSTWERWAGLPIAERVVLLIDEIDKADIEFPNDLLHELDRMRFTVMETGDEVAAAHRPVVIITSNAEKELPDAFLRRCIFHYIDFPDRELMARIVDVHHPGLDRDLFDQALSAFFAVRGMDRIRKPRAPASSSTGSPCCKPPGSTPWTSTTPRSWARC